MLKSQKSLEKTWRSAVNIRSEIFYNYHQVCQKRVKNFFNATKSFQKKF